MSSLCQHRPEKKNKVELNEKQNHSHIYWLNVSPFFCTEEHLFVT